MNICTDDGPFPETQHCANLGAQFAYQLWLVLKDHFFSYLEIKSHSSRPPLKEIPKKILMAL